MRGQGAREQPLPRRRAAGQDGDSSAKRQRLDAVAQSTESFRFGGDSLADQMAAGAAPAATSPGASAQGIRPPQAAAPCMALPQAASPPVQRVDLPEERRRVVLEKLLAAVGKGTPHKSESDMRELAMGIEEALASAFGSSQKEYVNKARSVLFNLNDPKNVDFRSMLLVGFVKPAEVPHLTPEQMASYDVNAERAKMRKESLEEVQSDWELKRMGSISSLLMCEKCKSSRTTYFQLQTRCGDEPMTTYALCLECGERWKS